MLLAASGLLSCALQPQRVSLHRRDAVGLGLGLAAPAVAWPLAAPAVATSTVAASTYASSTKLADGLVFPLASFGLQIYDDATAEQLTLRALEAGFRNFFASALAQNQRGFARGVRASGIARDELLICGSVVSNRALDADTAYKLTASGCAENAQAFAAGDVGPLDMIMLDYPGQDDACIRAHPKPNPSPSPNPNSTTQARTMHASAHSGEPSRTSRRRDTSGCSLGYIGLQPGIHRVAAWDT